MCIRDSTDAIESNEATLEDYRRYEYLLQQEGLPKRYIYEYLERAGFYSWEDLVAARKSKENRNLANAAAVGGIVGLGLGLLLTAFLPGSRQA